jgi:hypothetical protein
VSDEIPAPVNTLEKEISPSCSLLLQVRSCPEGDSLVARDGAGIPRDAAHYRKHRAVGPSKVQLADLLPGRYHGGARLTVGTFEFVHGLL